MATSLPTPGQLIVDNVTLLAGSPTAFNERYGHHLTPTTFAKPGNHGPANCLLHFLLCLIDPDLTEPLFKPCFPILDRDQERDFRRVVDSRLAVLEKTKLLPSGSARKSVIASGGGDRFLDLVWSLSTLAVQQACLRHPAYGSSSRLRMVSHNSRSDVLSHQSSARSNRSLFSVVSTRSERPQDLQSGPPSSGNAASRHRRFLGVGMLSASEQRARDAENARARIDAERVALERTVNVGKEGATTWASEADSLREKIGQFEANLARLKGQLADMGFDENGVDIRGNNQAAQLTARPPTPPSKSPLSAEPSSSVSDSSAKTSTSLTPNVVVVAPDNVPAPITSGSELRPSPSRDDFEHFKTSPFDSTESGSSVDDLQERDLSSDLSKLLTFSAETASARREVEESLKNAKSLEEMSLTPRTGEDNAAASDIVNLVRAATSELQQATDRMDEIRRERARVNGDEKSRKASVNEPSSGPSAGKKKSPEESNSAAEMSSSSVEAETEILDEKKDDAVPKPADKQPVSTVVKASSDNSAPLEQLASEAVEKHKQTVNAATKVRTDAAALSERSLDIIRETNPKADSTPVKSSPNEEEDKKWLTRPSTELSRQHGTDDVSLGSATNKPSRASADASRDLSVGSKALRNSTTAERKMRSDAAGRRLKATHRSLDSINLSANTNRTVNISPRYDTNCSVTPSPAAQAAAIKASRCVRFAELPPSYTRSRVSAERGPAKARPSRLATEVHPSLSRSDSQNDTSCAGTEKPKSIEPVAASIAVEKSIASEKVDSEKDEAKKTELEQAETIRPALAQKPRLQRRHTPHRIVSQKDAFQRAVAPKGTRKDVVPPRPTSGQVRTNQVIPRVTIAGIERDMPSPASSVQDGGRSRSSSPKPSKPRPSSVSSATADNTTAIDSPGASPSPRSSKDDISVLRSKPRISRQRSDMSEPVVPVSERSKAFSSTYHKSQAMERLAASPTPTSARTGSGDPVTSAAVVKPSEDKADSDVNTSAPDLSTTTESEKPNIECVLDAPTLSPALMAKPAFIVEKSDSSGSMIGSSEDWPGSQLSDEVQKSSMSAPDTTPTRSSRNHSKKSGLLRKSNGGMFGTFHVGKSRNNSSLKDGSAAGTNSDSADSLVSGGRPPLPQKNAPNRSSGGGFFAGEAAQWQENVRSHSSNDGAATNSSPRMSDEAGGNARNGRGGASVRAASANPPARKSRVHSFRARLAALK